jgi:Protein of unknown function (DUF1566)
MKLMALMIVSIASCGTPDGAAGDGGGDAAPGADTMCPQGSPPRGGLHWRIPNPAGLGLPNAAQYDTSTPGIVRDSVTALEWQQAVGGRYTQQQAEQFCQDVPLAGGPWRLPTVMELVSLVDDTKANPSIDPVAFPDTPGAYFWTSTARAGTPGMGWNVYFGLGDAYYYDVTDANAARCVRASPPVEDGCLAIQTATVYDSSTRLTWQQAVDTANRTWDQAVTYCQSLTLAGGGWRLPRLNELRSLVDFARTGPSIDPIAFPETPGENFWTASPFARTPGNVWYVYFQDGFAGYNVATSTYRVRCVR